MKPFWRRNVFGYMGHFRILATFRKFGRRFGKLGDKFGPKGIYFDCTYTKCLSERVQTLFNKLIIRGFQLLVHTVVISFENLGGICPNWPIYPKERHLGMENQHTTRDVLVKCLLRSAWARFAWRAAFFFVKKSKTEKYTDFFIFNLYISLKPRYFVHMAENSNHPPRACRWTPWDPLCEVSDLEVS